MSIFFPIEIAILNTAIIHFANNIWKLRLSYKNIHKQTLLQFGIIASIFSFIGSYVLNTSISSEVLYQHQLFSESRSVSTLSFIIGLIMILFAFIDYSPSLKKISFPTKYLALGGMLSGFFGGLSGHQGAIRSMFLIRIGLSKEMFIATGIAIACCIDTVRLINYVPMLTNSYQQLNYKLIGIAIVFAMIGAQIGNTYLKKTNLKIIENIVALALLCMGVYMML